jgi:hypothetical protein
MFGEKTIGNTSIKHIIDALSKADQGMIFPVREGRDGLEVTIGFEVKELEFRRKNEDGKAT